MYMYNTLYITIIKIYANLFDKSEFGLTIQTADQAGVYFDFI